MKCQWTVLLLAFAFMSVQSTTVSTDSSLAIDEELSVDIEAASSSSSFYSPQECLIRAVKTGNTRRVEQLLASGHLDPSVNGNEALIAAIHGGHVDTIEVLLADPRLTLCTTVLLEAVWSHRLDVFLCLYMHPRVPSRAFGSLAVVWAAEIGNADVVEFLLLDRLVDPAMDGNWALLEACHAGHFSVVELLLADERVWPIPPNALLLAVHSGNVEVVRVLLSHISPAHAENEAIQIASRSGHTMIVRLLLADHRCDPGVHYSMPLRYATISGHTAIVSLLLADPRVDPEGVHNDIIRLATHFNRHDIVIALLHHPRVDPFEVDFLIDADDPRQAETVRLVEFAQEHRGLGLEELQAKDLTALGPAELQILRESNRHNLGIVCYIDLIAAFALQPPRP
jgi:hypothetical protein